MPSLFFVTFLPDAWCTLASPLGAAVACHAVGSPGAPRLLPAPCLPACCLPGSAGASALGAFRLPSAGEAACAPKTKRERTVKQGWRCRESEQARFPFDCLFYLTLSLNIRSFYSLPEGCQAEEVTLRRKELAHTV